VLIERFFSEYTPFDEGLIYHAMGTGKTCAAFALAESLKMRKAFRQCVVLARGDDSLDNLRRELVNNCSAAYAVPTDVRTMEEEMRKIRRMVKDFYIFKTYYTFAKEVAAATDEILLERYDKTVFVVDEAHNIRSTDQDEDRLVYTQVFRLFHLSEGEWPRRKILLLTGTPMRDDVSELADIMNLLLPAQKQLPTGAQFHAEFLREEKDGTFSVRADKVELLKEYLRGRISYMTELSADIPILYKGVTDEGTDIPQFRSVDLEMEAHQARGYLAAFARDTTGQRRSIYTNSSQASLFVFPDGTWGAEGAAKFVRANGIFEPEFAALVLAKLRQFSVKYDHVVRTVRNPQNRRKNIYIYCSLVNGSGARLLAKILELHGYRVCQGNELGRAKRYMLLTSKTPNIAGRIAYYNRPENCFGEYCQIIIGSRKISEGYSFKNVQIEMLLTLFWNEAETAQAARRGARVWSWNALMAATDQPVMLTIEKTCAIPEHDAESSVDKLMLSRSKRKDVSIKRMDRVVKEVAFDCPLMYERNVHREAGDYSRECDYQVCEYTCDSVTNDAKGGLDISTYELYYENYFDLIEPIVDLFARVDSVSYDSLVELIRPVENIQLLKALSYLIENNVGISNRYKSECYLREYLDTYYLTQNVTAPSDAFTFSPLARPIFVKGASMDQVIAAAQKARTAETLREAKTLDDIVAHVPRETLDLMVKMAVKERAGGATTAHVDEILQRFKEQIFFYDRHEEYVAIYQDHNEVTWCLQKDGEWSLCVARIPREEPEGKYEGIIGEGDKFCLRKLGQVKGANKDKRKQLTGAVCEEAGWKKDKLLAVVDELEIPLPAVHNSWKAMRKADICGEIRKWLKANGLVRKGMCGTARKKKVV
jgi:hypothetical protein